MPRAKKSDHADITLTEIWDMSVVKQVILLKESPVDVVKILQTALKSHHGGQVKVDYRHPKPRPGKAVCTHRVRRSSGFRTRTGGSYYPTAITPCKPRTARRLAAWPWRSS